MKDRTATKSGWAYNKNKKAQRVPRKIRSAGRKTSGFTIIEVVLVLAVAGLIFLVVFAAIPRLQASRRDNARKDALRTFVSEMESFAANTGNSNKYTGTTSGIFTPYPYPAGTQLADFCDDYMYLGKGATGDHGWKDPSTGSAYTCQWNLTGTNLDEPGDIRYVWYYSCVGGEIVNNGATNRGYSASVASIQLERGSFCIDFGADTL